MRRGGIAHQGAAGGVQILYAPAIRALSNSDYPPGLPTGHFTRFGEARYLDAFWEVPYQSPGCRLFLPVMEGAGGNLVALMPNGAVGIRIAKSGSRGGPETNDPSGMALVADRLAPFCH